MTGYVASSSERHTGPVEIRVALAPDADHTAIALVEARVDAFLKAVEAGYFFPGTATSVGSIERGAMGITGRIQVADFATAAWYVLAGILADSRHHGASLRSAHVVFDGQTIDLLVDTRWRPAAATAPFDVAFTDDLSGNSALLVEIEFADPVDPSTARQLLAALALWDTLFLAYPIDPDEEIVVGDPQSHFNDPRTIHHHEWAWDNADPVSWNLLINLCCSWHGQRPIVRLHVE